MAGFQILPPEEDPAGRKAAAMRPIPAAPAPAPVDPRAAAIAEADAAMAPAPAALPVRAAPAEPMPAPAMEGAVPAGPSPMDRPIDLVSLQGTPGKVELKPGEKAQVKAVGSAGQAAVDANTIEADAQMKAADAMALAEKRAADDEAVLQQEADERERRFTSQMDNLDKDIETVRTAKVDRSKVWTSKNGFQKAAIIIAALLHGSMTRGKGGTAPSLQLLNQEIDNDVQDQMKFIDAQTKALAQKRQGIMDRDDMMAAREQSRLKAIAARRETIVMSLERIQAQAKSETGKAKVQALIDKMTADQLTTQEKYAALARQRAQGGTKFGMMTKDGVLIPLKREEAIKRAESIEDRDLNREKLGLEREKIGVERAVDTQKAAKDEEAKYVPGFGYARTAEEGKTLRSEAAGHNSVLKLTDELIAWREKNAGSLDPSKVAEGKAMARKLQLKAKDAAKLGVLSGSDLQLLEDQIPTDPSAWGQVLPKLKAFRRGSQLEFDERMKAAGLTKPEKATYESDFTPAIPDSGLTYKSERK